jgi:hypothetical protein
MDISTLFDRRRTTRDAGPSAPIAYLKDRGTSQPKAADAAQRPVAKKYSKGASLDLRALMGQVTGRKRHILVDTLACCLFRPLFF